MLLDEEPATLIQHTIGNFNIHPDKHAVARINESLGTLQQYRDIELRESEVALKKLARTLSTLSSHHAETLSSHSSTQHASSIADLDTQKFRIAKSASDLEIESERLASQLVDLQARLQELEREGVEGGENAKRSVVDDETTLRLKVYRSTGISHDDSKGGEGRVVVKNVRKGDVQVVHMDHKASRYFYANYFWGLV